MDAINHLTLCPVCGYDVGFEAWYEVEGGEAASHEICPSCGIEFGYDDVPEASGIEGTREQIYLRWRKRWISGGMRWNSPSIPQPPDWDLGEQLKRIGVEI
jgi:hypothetical protein